MKITKEKRCNYCGEVLRNRQYKYCNNQCQSNKQYEEYIERWKQGVESGQRGIYQLSNHIKRYIKEKYNYKCCKCGWGKINETTNTVPLEIHHKDGDYTNNDEDNLELLCPNCHSLTDTYKNALNHEGRKGRSKYYKLDNFDYKEELVS